MVIQATNSDFAAIREGAPRQQARKYPWIKLGQGDERRAAMRRFQGGLGFDSRRRREAAPGGGLGNGAGVRVSRSTSGAPFTFPGSAPELNSSVSLAFFFRGIDGFSLGVRPSHRIRAQPILCAVT